MTEEVEPVSRPVDASFTLSTADKTERKELPNNQLMQAHVEEVTIDDFGEGEKLGVRFVIDQDGEYQGENFKKWFALKASPKSGLAQVVLATFGSLPADNFKPKTLEGKPLQVMFQPDTFNGKAYQKVTYIPPVAGQKVTQRDTVITDPSEVDKTLEEVFGPIKTVE